MKDKKIKIIFAGTPDFAAYYLKKLILSKYTIMAVLTQPDRPNSRNKKTILSPVKTIALQYNIPILQPESFNNKENHIKLLSFQADMMLIIGYGVILPKVLLQKFPMGCINIHASLLPKLRGAAPIHWAILNGDKKTGITAIKINENLDSGDILYQQECCIDKLDTTQSLIQKLYPIGWTVILKTLHKIYIGKYKINKQNKQFVTYAKKLTKNMGNITCLNMNAEQIEKMVRALYPWPGVYIFIEKIRIKIHQVEIIKSNAKYAIGEIIAINHLGIQIQTKKYVLNIKKIQIPGRKIITISQLLHNKNHPFKIGKIL